MTTRSNALALGLLTVVFAGCLESPKNTTIKNKEAVGTEQIGGGCEGCELMYVGMPAEIPAQCTTRGWDTGKQKLVVAGKVLQQDNQTPAANVIIYFWHTDDQGLYASNEQTPAQVKPHGSLRGWVKSDQNGEYTIRTSRPAAYPNDSIPEHIHLSIKEPDLDQEYYADLYFEDDPLYPMHEKKYGRLNRAGNELLKVESEGAVQRAGHTIVLGLNIPNYPSDKKKTH